MSAANNAHKREQAKTANEQRRLEEKFARNVQKIEDKRSKPLDKLNELYADGKIDKKEFDKLKKRDKDITSDTILFGKASAVKLATRYITGKIDNKEYEDLKNEILGDVEVEKDNLEDSYKKAQKNLAKEVQKARKAKSGTEKCSGCGSEKKFLNPLLDTYDFKSCYKCKKELSKLAKFKSFKGQYYQSDAVSIDPDEPEDLTVTVLNEHILSFK